MKFKQIKGGKYNKINCKDAYDEYKEFEVLLKRYLIGQAAHNKIVDISCFYGINPEDFAQFLVQGGYDDGIH